MEELVDLIATQEPASEISNKIKDILYAKAAEKIDYLRPQISSGLFGDETEDQLEDQE
jgi:hypothetical protein